MNNSTAPASVAATPAQPVLPAKPKTPPHVRIPVAFIEQYLPKIGASAFTVYVALLRRNGKNDWCIPSHDTLAQDTGLSVATIKRALKTLQSNGLVSWINRDETTRKKRKNRQTSNQYFLNKFELPCQPKNSGGPGIKKSDKEISGEGVASQQSGGPTPAVEEEANKSPENEASAPSFSAEELEQWRAALIKLRCTPEEAARYAGPIVPRVVRWWATVNVLKCANPKGLLISRLQHPEKLPPEEEATSPAPKVEPTPEQKVKHAARRAKGMEICLSTLTPSARDFEHACVAREGKTLWEVLERDCSYELDRAMRQVMKEEKQERAH